MYVSLSAQSTCVFCLNVCIHGNMWACGCICEQCMLLWRSNFGGTLPTCTSIPLLPHSKADRQSTLWHLVQALWDKLRVCGIHSSFTCPAPFLSAMACWQSSPREALGTAQRLAWVFAHTPAVALTLACTQRETEAWGQRGGSGQIPGTRLGLFFFSEVHLADSCWTLVW